MFCYRYVDSEKRFQHVLEACGVNKSLKKLGVKEGDTVIVGEVHHNILLAISCVSYDSSSLNLIDVLKNINCTT